MRALLCPGQGAQKPGMLISWLPPGQDRHAHGADAGVPQAATPAQAVVQMIGQASQSTGLDLQELGTTATAEQLRETALAQPLLVVVSLASALHHGLLDLDGTVPAGAQSQIVAGHSLGEVSALALAGALTPLEAVGLAAARGAAMAACCKAPGQAPGGMCAVQGGQRQEVLAALAKAELVAANVNGSTQVVASGPLSALDALVPPPGARVVPLEVGGAFHSPAMAGAAQAVSQAVAALPERPLRRHLVDAATGQAHAPGSPSGPLLEALAAHLTAPVRWDLVQDQLADSGVSEVVELAPAGVLTALARRDLPEVTARRLRPPPTPVAPPTPQAGP